MKQDFSAPAHSLTSDTHMVIRELLAHSLPDQSITRMAIKNRGITLICVQLASLRQYPYRHGFFKYLSAEVLVLLGTVIMSLTKGCPD